MKASNRPSLRHQTLCCIGFLLLGALSPCANGQVNPVLRQSEDKQNEAAERDFKLRIAVEEVRLDAVVLDKKGRQITDLTADDFEISQDNLPQQVLSCTYVSDQTQPLGRAALSRKDSGAAPTISKPALERDQVRRVIVFIVDDLSMSFENIHNARLALTRFVERQMQPGDLVAILRTSRGISASQIFLSDRKQLLARIDSVRWGENVGRELADDNLFSLYDGQLAAIRYCIRALSNMPGRKALLLMSARTTLPGSAGTSAPPVDYQVMYMKAYNRLADEALRAGVVIHSLDIRGLDAPLPGASVAFSPLDALNPLPQKTGGLFVKETNFFVNGIGDVNDALKGFYILSYAPPATTFKSNRSEIYHRIELKVKRRGAAVHTRDGFYGITETSEESALAQNPLQEAIFSPFQNTDLNVHLVSGYIDDPKTGYLLSSWLHLDAKNVSIVEKKNEGHFISLETVCVTSDVGGYIRDANIMKYEFRVRDENLAWIKEHGIRFSLFLPVKKPGAYYVRVAVKDQVSGKVGSAYQFVEIPDLKKGRLALSDIFVVNREEDVAWIRSGVTKEISQSVLSPVLRRDESRSEALRSYFPGDRFQYMSVIYNAKYTKETRPGLESQFVLYKDGSEFLKSESQPLDLSSTADFNRIPVTMRLLLGEAMQAGDYVLQLLVRDRQRKVKESLASQTLDFEISGK